MARSSNLTRKLDQFVGGMLAWLLGRRPRPMPQAPKSILFIQPTAIGDTLIGSGAIEAIATRFPGAAITIAHGPSNRAAVKMLATPVTLLETSFANPWKALKLIKAHKPAMVIDLTPWPFATALAARLSGVWTAGFAPAINRRGRLFDLAVEHRTDRHEIQNLRALAYALGSDGNGAMKIRECKPPVLDGIDIDRLVLCHVSAGGAMAAAKAWPTEYWAQLAHELAAYGWVIGFTGVPADTENVEPIIVRSGLPEDKVHNLCGRLSLDELAGLLGAVPLLISVDTGVLHLSAAVEGRAIGLHGPTFARRWGSVSRRARGLDAPHAAAGFINYGWETHPDAEAIMPRLLPDTVLDCALDMLEPLVEFEPSIRRAALRG